MLGHQLFAQLQMSILRLGQEPEDEFDNVCKEASEGSRNGRKAEASKETAAII